MDDIEMRPETYKAPASAAAGLSKNMIIAISVIIGGGLAIGLGVGLGVGLNSVETIYVTVADKPTTNKPTTKSTTTSTLQTTGPSTAETETTAGTTTTPQTTTRVPSGPGPWQNYRLPEYIIPSHYKLTLHPNMTTDDYTGTNKMTINVTEKTKYVLFHAHSTLEITSPKLMMIDSTEVKIVNQFRWPEYEFYVVEAETELVPGEYVLTVEFYNSLVKAINGIYKSTYTDPETGEQKGVVGSDMEPTNARRGYPCFDEPAMKIRYTTIIIHEQIHTALSNMPVDYTEDIGKGLNETVFLESVPMSTYLGCFIVAELDFKEDFSGRGIPLRIYATKYQIDQGQVEYALRVTKAMFDKYENLLGVNYTLPKYDQIAIPNFGAGAMENWGLVTYRETNLLWDPQDSSTYNKQRVAAVIAHEMVHQWFGNLVTMKWWDNLWLNEGFASYLEYIGMGWAEPDWVVDGHFVVDDLQVAMSVDSSTGSHPIIVNVSTPAQISEVFDTITYQKGSTILRMMNDILGDALFFGGLNRYLNNMEFSNADEHDLWSSVQEHIDEVAYGSYNVKEIMDPWVQQFGFPVIDVDTTLTLDKAVASQQIMLTDADVNLTTLPDSDYDYKWEVKLNYFTETDPAVKEAWLNSSDTNIVINVTGFGSWTKFNADVTGYYRVNYDTNAWNAIVEQLQENHTVFNEVDRTSLLDDALNLAPAEKITYDQALNMTKYLDMEESYFVWRAFSRGSSYIEGMLRNTDYYTNFKTYYLSKVKPIADKIGWNVSEGTHEEKRMRPYVLGLALSYGDEDALNKATQLFADWRADKYIHPDIRELVYRYGILAGTAADWEYMLGKYQTESVAGEKTNLLRGLAATEDIVLIDRLLEYSKNSSFILDQDFFNCITYISYSINGNIMSWSWVRINWDYMVDRFSIESRNLGRLIPSIVEYYNTELQKWEVQSFFDANPEAGAGVMNRNNALIQLDLNIVWMAENADTIGVWLQYVVPEM